MQKTVRIHEERNPSPQGDRGVRPQNPTKTFILASGSPRRSTLLASAGMQFDIYPCDIAEVKREDELPWQVVRRFSYEKADHISKQRWPTGDHRLILGADTIVVVDGEIIGKPPQRDAAFNMLRRLSNREHKVITGFCVLSPDGGNFREEVTTRVIFKKLCEEEIERYLDLNEWCDKAGGYAVQGGAAYMVRSIVGSYTNVVGLPLSEAVEALTKMMIERNEA